MKARIKGYYDVATFEIAPVKDTGKRGREYMRFVSNENVKRLYDFYKNEMQQGEKPNGCNVGRSHIADTGFFDRGYQHWNEFKAYIPRIIYKVTLIDKNLLEITPVTEGLDTIEEAKILDV